VGAHALSTATWDQLTTVRVFELDTKSPLWIERRSIGQLGMLVSLSSSKCIIPSGPEIKSNHIYFLDHFCLEFLLVDGHHFSHPSQIYSLATRAATEQLIGRE
jgi:hypothetical protein